MQAGDVINTSSDCELLKNYIGIDPLTPIDKGIKKLFHGIKIFIIFN